MAKWERGQSLAVTAMHINGSLLPRIRAFQLFSPSLPVGAFAYSQGLEWAVENGWVKSQDSFEQWLSEQLRGAQAQLEIPIFKRLYLAISNGDRAELKYWCEYLRACRETSELRAEDAQRAQAMVRLLVDLEIPLIDDFSATLTITASAPLAFACRHFNVELREACAGFVWSWLENQVTAGIKLIPLGQTSGQAVLIKLAQDIDDAVAVGLDVSDEAIGFSSPALSIASALHESQYTRLFRS